MKTPRLVRGVFFRLQKLAGTLPVRVVDRSHALRGNATPVTLRVTGRGASPEAFPRGAWERSTMGFGASGNETSVMKLTALRPNVADYAGCSTVAKNATTPCTNQPFT
ncbi:hypothetical protein CQ009_26225 [Pseudomonas sp. MYb2]|nr:hypothetical protein CQ025_26520 [Pseudomonas sp. MYb3]PRC27303.1 hypothetical protein CQ009_26225 [Pseudomonas sp. MYb2]